MNCSDHLLDLRDPPPFTVVRYIEQYGNRLHWRRFSAMHLAGDVREACEVCTGRVRDIAVGVWIKRCWHWDGCGVADSLCHYTQTDSQ